MSHYNDLREQFEAQMKNTQNDDGLDLPDNAPVIEDQDLYNECYKRAESIKSIDVGTNVQHLAFELYCMAMDEQEEIIQQELEDEAEPSISGVPVKSAQLFMSADKDHTYKCSVTGQSILLTFGSSEEALTVFKNINNF